MFLYGNKCLSEIMPLFPLQVSVGTLLGFTAVAISVLILRYVPPDEASVPSSLSESVDSVSLQFNSETQEICREHSKDSIRHPLLDKVVAQSKVSLIINVIHSLSSVIC